MSSAKHRTINVHQVSWVESKPDGGGFILQVETADRTIKLHLDHYDFNAVAAALHDQLKFWRKQLADHEGAMMDGRV